MFQILSLQLPRNPYCSNEGTHCDCRLPHVTFQPQLVSFGDCGRWGVFGNPLEQWRNETGGSCSTALCRALVPLNLSPATHLWLLYISSELPLHNLWAMPRTRSPQLFTSAVSYSFKIPSVPEIFYFNVFLSSKKASYLCLID